jgi:hypothetical protein
MRHTDAMYDERYREHSRNGCISVAPQYLCKLCRSYEAGRNAALDMVRGLVGVDPVVRDDMEHDHCLYCRAELKGERSDPGEGHDANCPWQSARLLLDGAVGPKRVGPHNSSSAS